MNATYVEKQLFEQANKNNEEKIELEKSDTISRKKTATKRLAKIEINIYIPQTDEDEEVNPDQIDDKKDKGETDQEKANTLTENNPRINLKLVDTKNNSNCQRNNMVINENLLNKSKNSCKIRGRYNKNAKNPRRRTFNTTPEINQSNAPVHLAINSPSNCNKRSKNENQESFNLTQGILSSKASKNQNSNQYQTPKSVSFDSSGSMFTSILSNPCFRKDAPDENEEIL